MGTPVNVCAMRRLDGEIERERERYRQKRQIERERERVKKYRRGEGGSLVKVCKERKCNGPRIEKY